MLSRLSLGSVLLLAGVACTDASEPSTTSAATTSITTSVPTTTPVPIPSTVGPGRLAIIENDGTIAVMEPDGSERVTLTEAAGEAIYTQPIWSPDSSLVAFGEIDDDGFAVRVEGVDGESGVSIPVPNNPFFMYWSPNSEKIGVLHNGSQGLDFEMADVSEGTIEVLDSGSPFYFSWSPDSQQVVIHEGADRFEILDLSGESTRQGETAAGYLAPQWLPQGILHVVDDRLVLEAEDGPATLAEVGEQTMFVASDDGGLVVWQTLAPRAQTVSLGQSGQVGPNVVAVLDTRSLEVEIVDTAPAVGLWWSPDGRSVLLLTPALDGASLTAKVWSADEGLVEYATYRPSPLQVRDVFPFFPQYAQSMTFWSPDSSGFAIAGEIEGEAGIWIQGLDASQPVLVSEGLWVAWSSGG